MLASRTILIVEAQYIVALDVEATLGSLGAEHVVIAQDPAHAALVADQWADCTLAIVEIEREKPDQIALAGDLVRRGIAVIGLTTDTELPRTHAWISSTPIVLKPVQSNHLIAAVARAMSERPAQNE